jgi:hypothetical protein
LPAVAQPAGDSAYSQEELDQLLAPIALYPDQLLTQILIAATYPIDVVEAARFVAQNPQLNGEVLDQALADQNWDPSVQSLAAFPQVLAMMSDKLSWTQRLGNAFLVDQPLVMNTVQTLRRKAQAIGNLRQTAEQSVLTRDDEILIEPAQTNVVYVPVYDPFVIYGPWWAPAYPPWYWYPPTSYGYAVGAAISTGIIFGFAWAISQDHWSWARPDWRGHRITLNTNNSRFWNRAGNARPLPNGDWQHTPAHRRGVAYPNAPTRDRYSTNPVDPQSVRARQDFRGRDRVQAVPNAVVAPQATPRQPRIEAPRASPPTATPNQRIQRSPPSAAAPALDPGQSRQQTHIDSQRGQESRRSGPSPSAVRQAPARQQDPARQGRSDQRRR